MNTVVLDDLALYGKEYRRYVDCKKRYRIVKGSIASKKSMNTARNMIERLLTYPNANLICFRKYEALLRSSCRAELVKAIYAMGVQDLFKIPRGDMTITVKNTGQVILFRGCMDTMNLSSITVERGYLCWAWIEEMYEISEEDFNRIDDRLRGQLPPELFYQITGTFNPWHEMSWTKKRFFELGEGDTEDGEIPYKPGRQLSTSLLLAITRNYYHNEFLDQQFLERMERMRIQEPNRYRIAGEGEWGTSGDTIYADWRIEEFDFRSLFYERDYHTNKPLWNIRHGLDFGWSDQTAGVMLLEGELNGKRTIYICEEYFEVRQSRDDIANRLKEMGWDQYRIHADSENPELIDALKKAGLPRIFGVRKAPGSVYSGIAKLRDYQIIIHPTCTQFAISIAHYAWKTGLDGKPTMTPLHDFSHLMDAMRYAFIDEEVGIAATAHYAPPGITGVATTNRALYEQRLNYARRKKR
jgi:phage terminase, large subunit, PBSX family|nr:MAG TPA: terminase large subunit [Caudoviricetes sp.]